MTNNIARAAELWARLEQRLIGCCGLRDSFELRNERPALIRTIGDAISQAPPEPLRPVARVQENRLAPAPEQRHTRKPPAHSRASLPPDSAIDRRLSELLDRASSRRAGSDGDDEVNYA